MTEISEDWPFWEYDGEERCHENLAIAAMLKTSGLLFLSGDAGPFFGIEKQDEKPTEIFVNCNDLFAWGSADAEPLPHDKIGEFFKAWKDGKSDHWCCKQRGYQPQRPIRNRMRKEGTWDAEMQALPKNMDDQ